MNSSTEPVTCNNVMELDLDEVRVRLFELVEKHDLSLTLDTELYVRLLGEYAGLYQYVSEIYVYLIARVRAFTEAKNIFKKIKAQDRRDCLEHILKVIKFNYDSLSRKVTILSQEDRE